MALTRAQIMAEGLAQAGRSDLIVQARLWLNMFLERMYLNQDFAWLLKSTTLTPAQGVSLPTDYRSAKAAMIGTLPILVVEVEEYSLNHNASTQAGTPDKMYVDLLNKTAYFSPSPSSGLVLYLDYYHKPVLPDHTDSGTDSLSPLWRLGDHILTQAVYIKALEYNDDLRFKDEDQKLNSMIAEAKMNSIDSRAGRARLKFGKSFKRRF